MKDQKAIKLKRMNEDNLKIEKERLDGVRKLDAQLDMRGLEQRIKLDDRQDNQRVRETLDRQQIGVEQDKKVALAAMGITRSRDLEKDKLTIINVNRQKVKDEQTHLRAHMTREI